MPTVTQASGTTRADIVINVSRSAACVMLARIGTANAETDVAHLSRRHPAPRGGAGQAQRTCSHHRVAESPCACIRARHL